jgi:hypothetical protein
LGYAAVFANLKVLLNNKSPPVRSYAELALSHLGHKDKAEIRYAITLSHL